MAHSNEYVIYDSEGDNNVRTVVQNMQMMAGMHDKPVFTMYKGVGVAFNLGDDVGQVSEYVSNRLKSVR